MENHCEAVLSGARALLLLIHYWLPVMLGWSLALVIQRAGGWAFSHTGLTLLLAGIGAAYSVDRIVDFSEQGEISSWLKGMLWGGAAVCSGTILFLIAAAQIDTGTLEVVTLLSVLRAYP